jgi:hypothetical protein
VQPGGLGKIARSLRAEKIFALGMVYARLLGLRTSLNVPVQVGGWVLIVIKSLVQFRC